jgi:hypothetical protein
MLDRRAAESELDQLPSRDHVVLSLDEIPDRLSTFTCHGM